MLIVDLVRLQQIGVIVAGVLAAAIGVMHQAWLHGAASERHAERRQRQLVFQRAIQRPSDHAARVGVQNHRQEHELVAQANVGNIGPPELIGRGQDHVPRQVRIHSCARGWNRS